MITFTRGKLSKMSGVHIETIRFYENEGVLPEPQRAHNGYRLYDKKYVLMLTFITEARKLDFSLKEIREIIKSLFEKQSKAEAEQLLEQKVENIQQSIQELKKRKAAIQLLTKQTLANIS
ncbi:MerR family transcriptional regulator [Bacillus safensis]|uniref:MerR family transcriptional regulator n=1 Tax=Bacillus safensis TaxID=561879 RepID=UPI002041E857|nr:MerR family transcriptional regulator [Bacillus safensis]MCM2989205.1 MerR family transcriptional regulator [Bacillus safensis]